MRIPILLILPLLLSACAVGDVNTFGQTYPARPSDWPISIYAQGDLPPEVVRVAQTGTPPGKAIGGFEVSAPKATPWKDLVSKARSKARSIGGDAVLFTGSDIYLRVLRGRVYRSNP